MRVLTLIVVVLTLLVGAFFGYCYSGARMRIEAVYAQVTPALEAQEAFAEVTGQVADGTFYGTKYREAEFLMPDSFAFLTLSVRMENRGLFPMDWIRIEVRPDAADVLQLANDRAPSLFAGSRADFTTTLLTRLGADTTRKVIVTYYVLGRAFSAEYEM